MPRTIAACVVPAAVVCAAWLAVEDPPRVGEAVLVALLGVAPALVPRVPVRAVALMAAGVVAAWAAYDVFAWELLPFRDERVVEPVLDSVYIGVGDFYGVVLPFDPLLHPEMHALVLVAIFGFVSVCSLLVAAERPLAAAAVVAAAVGWPATLVGARSVAIGAAALGAALWILLVRRVSTVRALLAGALVSVAVVAGAVSVSSATSFARGAVLQWESWDFRGLPARALGVRFVWNANYDGISFPPTKTTVLEIEGPARPQYWRASTLNGFSSDRWFEDLYPQLVAAADRDVPRDPLAPPLAGDRDRWIEQEIRVKALVDDRVVAAGTPVAIDAPTLGTVFYLSGGVIAARRTPRPGTSYRVWSYVPEPSPAELAAARPRYPQPAREFLRVWGQALPPFGQTGRRAHMESLLAGSEVADRFGLTQYRPMWEVAQRIAGDAVSPYEAVLAIESWLRRTGGFTYQERPSRPYDLPPLVEFVTRTKAGYCQHFAGAMAVMLRLLGVPARVAVGFTSGTWNGRRWIVTDHDAHAWVEVWFPRHGWVAFDPTPGRGTLAGAYSYASENARAVDALGRGIRTGSTSVEGSQGRGSSAGSGGPDLRNDAAPTLFGVALLLSALWILGVWAAKAILRQVGRMTRDSRRSAAASRRELEAFLRDQGASIPPSTTLATLGRLAHEELGIDVRPFADAAARGRFGPPHATAAAAASARRELRVLLERARRELSLWARVRGLVSLRSLRGSAP